LARLSRATGRDVSDVQSALRSIVDGGPSALSWLPGALQDVTGARWSICCSYAPRGDGMRLEQGFIAGASESMVPFTDQWLADKSVGWTAFNPMAPEPAQRNAVLTLEELARVSGIEDVRQTPVMRECYARFGLARDHQLRLLVCEGPSLLAYISVAESAPFSPTQRRALSALTSPLARRLSIERLLGTAETAHAALEAAMDQIPAAAFLLGAHGLVDCNQLGSSWLATDRTAKVQELLDAVQRGSHPSFRIIPVTTSTGTRRHLLVARVGRALRHACRVASAQWGLSARQAQVLELLSEGLTNQAIAAALKVSPKTVEFHLRAMFEKAQAETRSELVVRAVQMLG